MIEAAQRVVKNTGFLYVKMLLTILISLYSTRLILNALGEVDYGIFNLVGGVIAMLSFINGAMIIATQRYLSFSLGEGSITKTKFVFSSSIILHLIISCIIVLGLEATGFFLFNGILNIPPDRMHTAKIVFHFMVISTFFTINAVPYDASINAHEDFLFDAILGIAESITKLGIAIWLIYAQTDKLILYGLLIAGLTIFIRIIKLLYCHKNYAETQIRIRAYLQIRLLKEMLSFAGWNVFGLFLSVLKNQGLAILLNMFFGILINAAYGIANQVNSNIRRFSTNMIRAMMPQITKSEGSGDHARMLRLSVFASKMSFFLLAFFALPLIVEMPFVLKIWLKTVPENAVIFCQLMLVISLLYQITVGAMAAVTSVGDIKAFQIAVGMVEVFNLPVAFLLIKLRFPAYFVFVGLIFLEFIAGGFRVWFAHKIAGLDIKDFVIKTWLFSLLSAGIAASLSWMLRFFVHDGILRVVFVLFTSTVSLVLQAKFLVLTKEENKKIWEVTLSFYHKIIVVLLSGKKQLAKMLPRQ